MADPIRALLRELLDFAVLCDGLLKGEGLWDDDSECDGGLLDRVRTALAAEPPAPDPREVIAVRPLLEAVVALDVWGVEIYDGRLPALQHRIRAWLAENPPGQPVAIEPRGCPTPGACSCVEAPAPADPSDFQTLQGIALDMVESLRPIVIPEILGVLRRAIKQAPAPAPAADGAAHPPTHHQGAPDR